MIRERQAEGIKRAMAKGKRFGLTPKVDDRAVAKVRALRAEGKLIREIMAETALSKATVYRALGRTRNQRDNSAVRLCAHHLHWAP